MPTTTRPDGGRHSAEGVRAALLLVVVGALIAGAVVVLVRGPTSTAAPAPVVAAPAATTSSSVPPEPSTRAAYTGVAPGTCLTWSAPDAADITETGCAQPHLFEVAASIDLSGYPGPDFGRSSARPATQRMQALRDELCVPAVTAYLAGRFDPEGRFTVGLINPGSSAWAQGQRTVRCGLQEVGRGGTPFPTTGTVAESDQSDVTPVGTCLGIDATLPTDPVDCALPHAAQTVALVDLSLAFAAGFPAPEDQDRVLDESCAKASDAFTGTTAGADGAAEKGLTVFWDNVGEASWAAGSTKVNCYLGQELPGGGFAPITGDARGPVEIGTTPAPPAAPPAPGPAPGPPIPTAVPQDALSATPPPAPGG